MFNFYETMKRLAPIGEAYKLFKNTENEKLVRALAEEPGRIKDFYDLVQLSGVPDGNIPADALSDWETFLNLPKNDSLTDEERNQRITGKYAGQGGQGPDYIQDVMQAAGFPVYVFENIPPVDPTGLPGIVIHGPPNYTEKRRYDATLGGFTLGSKTLGAFLGTGIEPVEVAIPSDSTKWIYVFFLTGPSGLGDFVNISADKETDFRNQILQIKPAHAWVLAQVNFI